MSQPLMYWNDVFGKTQPHMLSFAFTTAGNATNLTAVTNVTSQGPASCWPIIVGTVPTQAQIDSFLGTSSEFTAAQFDAASVPADSVGFIINMGGQCKSVLSSEIFYSASTGTVTKESFLVTPTAFTDTAETALSVGASGNIGIRVACGSTFSATEVGVLSLKVYFISK